MDALLGLGVLWVILLIAYFVGCFALGGWLASEKGYSVGSWIVLLLLFGVLALIVLVGAPDKKGRIKIEEKKSTLNMEKLKIIFASLDNNINVKQFETYILSNKNETGIIYEILNASGKVAMNQYIKKLLLKIDYIV